MNVAIEQENKQGIHPHKFALWLGIASMVMMFAALTSAYLVRRSAGNWLEFKVPDIFFVSTVVLLISSMTLHSSYLAYKKGKEVPYKGLLLVTFALGFAFLVLQYQGWLTLYAMDIQLNTNPSASFLYVIFGLHALHIIGGISALIFAMIKAFKLKFKVTEKRKVSLEMVLIFWHFLDILWIYLLLFIIFQ